MYECEQEKELYIGEVFVEDIHAFCNMSGNQFIDFNVEIYKQETGVVPKLRLDAAGEKTFCWPAALTSFWYVYRGMLKEAIIFDIILILICNLLPGLWDIFAISCFCIIRGLYAMHLYNSYIKKRIQARGILMREAITCEILKENLAAEGKPSMKRVIIYALLECLVLICINSILFCIASCSM